MSDEVVEEANEPEEPDEIQTLIDQYNIKIPKYWETYSQEQKIEFIAHRILLDSRTSTKHSDIKEEGWLSNSQLERRRRKEVLSKFGSWDEIPPKKGTFGRAYNPNSKEV